jgi:hypothetical protein
MRIILVLLLLTACSTDQDYYDKPTTEISAATREVKVVWRQVKDVDSYCRKYYPNNLEYVNGRILGCSAWTVGVKEERCTIILEENSKLETIGHELKHCFDGHFHNKPQNKPFMVPPGSGIPQKAVQKKF